MTHKEEAAALLHQYDDMKLKLLLLERELAKACADYGRTRETDRTWGFTKDMLRNELKQGQRGEAA
jgi:hypothetical protein